MEYKCKFCDKKITTQYVLIDGLGNVFCDGGKNQLKENETANPEGMSHAYQWQVKEGRESYIWRVLSPQIEKYMKEAAVN